MDQVKRLVKPEIIISTAEAQGVFALKWMDDDHQERIFPLLEIDKDLFPDTDESALISVVMYVGPLIAFPNMEAANKISQILKSGYDAWCVLGVMPFYDQSRPYRVFAVEIDRKDFLQKQNCFPRYYHEPEAIHDVMKKTWDHMG